MYMHKHIHEFFKINVIHSLKLSDNLVFKVLLTNILQWKMDPELIFCEHETDLATDGSAIACL